MGSRRYTRRLLACSLLACSLLVVCWPSWAAAQDARKLEFTANNAEFLNPERGFYRYRDLTRPTAYDRVRAQGQTLIYGRVQASEFRDRPLSSEFLAKIQAGFDEARQQGLKVKFRLAYNNGFDEDAPKSVILGHIQQLQPLWERNKDVMFHMDAGFIGAWGEWHSSTNGLDNQTDRREILFAILDALPTDRTVGIRTPHFKREIFTGSQLSNREVITEENAFDGSRLTRVGHLNDCFLSSPDDVGTYALLGNNWPLERELDYIGGESRFVPFGGETCGLHERSASPNALREMEQLHIDYLNLDYHPDVLQRWRDEGSFDEIQRRLGYRFALKSAELPTEVRPGALLPLKFTIDNVGFGELFNPRRVEVVLRNVATGELLTAPLGVDPRRWTGGETNDVATWLTVPETLAAGQYAVGLWLPDVAPNLRNDVRYAIRFANDGVWDEATGVNQLTDELTVNPAAAGAVFETDASFREVVDPNSLNLRGDFDRDGELTAGDIDALSAAVGGGNVSFDLSGDGMVTQVDRELWVYDLARTRFGDVDLNGLVEFADFVRLSREFGSAGGGWGSGDFDASGEVDFTDFVLLASNFTTGGAVAESVPESSSPTLTWLPALLIFHRRRRG